MPFHSMCIASRPPGAAWGASLPCGVPVECCPGWRLSQDVMVILRRWAYATMSSVLEYVPGERSVPFGSYVGLLSLLVRSEPSCMAVGFSLAAFSRIGFPMCEWRVQFVAAVLMRFSLYRSRSDGGVGWESRGKDAVSVRPREDSIAQIRQEPSGHTSVVKVLFGVVRFWFGPSPATSKGHDLPEFWRFRLRMIRGGALVASVSAFEVLRGEFGVGGGSRVYSRVVGFGVVLSCWGERVGVCGVCDLVIGELQRIGAGCGARDGAIDFLCWSS